MKKRSSFPAITIEIIAALYVFLFLYTGISKLQDLQAMEGALRHSPLLADHAHLLSRIVPIAEILASILLIFSITRFIGLIVSTFMMLWFTIYIIYMMTHYTQLPCTCGGITESLSWRGHLLLNSAFVSLGICAICLSIYRFTMINRSSRIPVENSRQFVH